MNGLLLGVEPDEGEAHAPPPSNRTAIVSAVLLWLTDLGPSYTAKVAELTVS